jgi:hypothetical protein
MCCPTVGLSLILSKLRATLIGVVLPQTQARHTVPVKDFTSAPLDARTWHASATTGGFLSHLRGWLPPLASDHTDSLLLRTATTGLRPRLRACGFVNQSTAMAMRWATGSPVCASTATAAQTIDRRASTSCGSSPWSSMFAEMRSSSDSNEPETGARALRAWYAARLSFCTPFACARGLFSGACRVRSLCSREAIFRRVTFSTVSSGEVARMARRIGHHFLAFSTRAPRAVLQCCKPACTLC